MPSMFEIYAHHALEYDRLVEAEDFQGNLRSRLLELIEWDGKHVLEGGVGTGRITQIYIAEVATALCIDQSSHMIQAGRRRLIEFMDRLEFLHADNLHLPKLALRRDIYIEGWSWGHSIVSSSTSVKETTDSLLANVGKNLVPDGTVVLIETLGTNVPAPTAPHPRLSEFYSLLVDEHGFQPEILRTDYRFVSPQEAAEACGFFFGDQMRQDLEAEAKEIVPEYTGVWFRTMA